MAIRLATTDDARIIAHVHVEAWRTAYRGILPDTFLEGLDEQSRYEMWQAILTRDSPKEFTFVAELDGEIVGFAGGGPERKNDPNFSGELIAIYLLDNFRGRGIGTALFKRVVEELIELKMDSMKVWVLRDYPFRAFYEHHGGIVVAEKSTRIAETDLIKIAYGWKNLAG